MKIICKRHHLHDRAMQYGVDLDAIEACYTSLGDADIEVDTDHPAYPRAPTIPDPDAVLRVVLNEPTIDAERTLKRRLICLGCEHVNDVQSLGCHCREKGDRPSCAHCRVLWPTSNDSACPLNKWVDAKPAPAPVAFGSNIGKARSKSTPAAESLTFPIDLVYLWVDGSDPKWLASFKAATKKDTEGTRFIDAGELKYSLRSVDRFAPWINRVFVVADQQRPQWLVDNPRVTVVDHAEIIDAKYLPVFGSHAIEPHIHKIPGLSEHLLFANDDTMFGAPVKPGHFFQADGKAIVAMDGSTRTTEGGIYNAMRNRGADLLDGAFGKSAWELGWHQIKAYRRSMLADAADRFAAAVDECSTHKLRSSKDVAWNCALWPAFSVAAGYGVKASERLDDFYLNPNTSNARQRMAKAIKRMPHLMCINNGRAEDAPLIREFLEAYLPSEPARTPS